MSAILNPSGKRVTVIGAGFGALSTVRELRRRDPQVEITVVSPRAELHYLPGIIWMTAALSSLVKNIETGLRNSPGPSPSRPIDRTSSASLL